MSKRDEYFTILAALIAAGDYSSISVIAETAYRLWAAGNRVCKDAGLPE